MRNRKQLGEFELIDRLKKVFGTPAGQTIGIGDDAALIRPKNACDYIWTTDAQVEGTHFKNSWLTPTEMGYRSAVVSLSDCAAMGSTPKFALVSFHLPKSINQTAVLSVAKGIQALFRKHGTQVMGGNITRDKTFSTEVSILGEVRRGETLLRSGANVGDDIWVTGFPGTAALAITLFQERMHHRKTSQCAVRKFKKPMPRIEEAKKLRSLATAMVDISDGLLADASHVAKASRVALWIEKESMPISRPLTLAARSLGRPFSDFHFAPSDDYELLFTAPPAKAHSVRRRLGRLAARIGFVRRGRGEIYLLDANGHSARAQPIGWDHFKRGL